MRWFSLQMVRLVLGVLLFVSACAPPASSPSPVPSSADRPAAAAETPATRTDGVSSVRTEGPRLNFKFASSSPETDLSGLGYKHWAKLIEERTGGRITFQFFWAGSLLNSQRQFQGIRDGQADFGGPSMATVSGQIPDVALFEVPFAFPTDLELTNPFYREVEPILDEIFSQGFNQKVVYANPSTTADPVTCRHRFLDSEQAWQGALVRTAGKWQARTLEVWGAKPVVIDSGDVYAALQRGTADCLLFVYNLIDSFKIYEVAKYLTRIDHSINLQVVTANLDAWNKLPPEDQAILIAAGRETQEFLVQQRSNLVAELVEKFKAEGVHVCTPSQQELQRLQSATEPVLQEIAAQQTEKGRQMQEIARSYRARMKALGPSEGDMTPCPGA